MDDFLKSDPRLMRLSPAGLRVYLSAPAGKPREDFLRGYFEVLDGTWRPDAHQVMEESEVAVELTLEELRQPITYVENLSLEDEKTRINQFLESHPFPDDIGSSKQTDGKRPSLFTRPLLPASVYNADQHYMFGWAITQAWLTTLCPCTMLNITYKPMRFLKHRSGFQHFELVQGVHGRAPLEYKIRESNQSTDDGLDPFLVLVICHTADYAGFEDRPTTAQYEWLKQLLPGEPQWFRCAYSKKELEDLLAL